MKNRLWNIVDIPSYRVLLTLSQNKEVKEEVEEEEEQKEYGFFINSSVLDLFLLPN
jgi:hypothetical protein